MTNYKVLPYKHFITAINPYCSDSITQYSKRGVGSIVARYCIYNSITRVNILSYKLYYCKRNRVNRPALPRECNEQPWINLFYCSTNNDKTTPNDLSYRDAT